jgi:hypothetical protein
MVRLPLEVQGEVHVHDHAVVVYDDRRDLEPPLARFVEHGVARNELCLFLHSFSSDDEAWALLERAIPNARAFGEEDRLRMGHHEPAFERNGRISHDHVASVVTSLVEETTASGRSGLRIFVDASRKYFDQGRAAEWFAFESWLGTRLKVRVGLVCAYRRGDVMTPNAIADVLRTHLYRFDAAR